MSSLLPAFLLALAAAFAPAALAAPIVKTEHVEAALVAEFRSAQPGKPVHVGLRLRMVPHWHTYWKNPGDSGLPTRIQWELPPGWKAGEIQWPYPQPLPVGPLMNYGYEDEVVLLVPLTPPATAQPGPAQIRAKAEWLVCKDVCIPEKGELDLALPVSPDAPQLETRWQASIERARAMLPAEARGWQQESAVSGKTLIVRLTAPEGAAVPAKATFFPEREQLIEPAAPQKVAREGTRTLRFEMKMAEPPAANVTTVNGVAVSQDGWPGIPRKAIEVRAPASAALAAAGPLTGTAAGMADANAVGGSVLAALAFAFLGGVLLNLMPCVFPVLGIKVMGFVEHAHGDARALRLQGLVFGAGVVASFLVLAAIMIGLRATGVSLGWGFQLQSPVFVTLLAALFFALALNLSGVFEWGLFAQSMTSNLSARGRYADALLAGVLATVVATPCTAPFMGAAVGFTLSQPAPIALLVFATLGVGMALPVVALAFYPALLKRLPRPGPWMETFKQVLAFPLFATVAWLAWVLGGQAGNDAVLALLVGLVSIAIAAWIYGRWQHSAHPLRFAAAALFALLGLYVAWPHVVAPGATMAQAKPGEMPWQEWSPEKVAQLTAAGRPVFVDFTAAWCVTCQVNKRVALNNAKVIQAFAERGIVPLKADWTASDPRITATLAALGRNAIPVYALYLPGETSPRLLPELLTPNVVLEHVAQLPATQPQTALTQR
jgi:thiol:disulfide interchange protein